MKKRIIKGILVTFAAAAVCVPIAACGFSGNTGSTTAATTEEATTGSTSAEGTTSASEGAKTETTSPGSGETAASAESTETTSSGGSSAATGEVLGLTPLENVSVKNESLQIDVKGYKVYPAGVGGASNSLKPVVVFYYDVINNSDKETDALSAWTEIFDAYQNAGEDDRNLLGQGIFVDESISSENGTIPMKKGDKKSYYKSYELTDDTTSVTLRSHDGLGGAKLGDDIIVRVMS